MAPSPDDQKLSPQDMQDLREIASHLPNGHPLQGKLASFLSSQPTEYEKSVTGGADRGVLSGLTESIGGAQAPTAREAAEAGIPALGVAHQLWNAVAQAPENYKAGGVAGALAPLVGVNPQSVRQRADRGDVSGIAASVALPTVMGLWGAHSALKDVAGIAPEARQPVAEARLPERATPISTTGKLPVNAGSIAPEMGGTIGLPEINFAKITRQLTPEVHPVREVQIQQAAEAVAAKPNPAPVEIPKPTEVAKPAEQKVTIQLGPSAQVETPQALLEKPTPPKGRATKGDPAWQQYAADRSAWMKQQKDIARQTTQIPVPSEQSPLDQYNDVIKRYAKTPANAPEMPGRISEFKALLDKGLPDEQARELIPQLKKSAERYRAQITENERVAAAPEKIAQLEDQKGGKLLGEWTRYRPEDAARVAEGGEVEPLPRNANTPFYKSVNMNEVPPAERDLYHKLLGHGTTQVITRDAQGHPMEIKVNSDEELAEVNRFVADKQAEQDREMDVWRGSGIAPPPESIEKMADLQDAIETYGKKRDRLAIDSPRKGLPIRDEQGVVRAPGAIPDIGQKTGNALLGRPEGAHFKKPDAARLAAYNTQLRTFADLNEQAANALEAKLKPVAAEEPKPANFAAGFPVGEVGEKLQSNVETLHNATEPQVAGQLSEAVRQQGLATRDAAVKLYGKALATYAKTEDLGKAMDVATRRGEAGHMRANFLGDILSAANRKLTPGANETPLDLTRASVREAGAKQGQYIARSAEMLRDVDKAYEKMPVPADWRNSPGWQMQKDVQSGIWKTKFPADSAEYKTAALLREMLDKNREMIQASKPGALREYDENYFPQRWQGINDLDGYMAKFPKAGLSKANFLKNKFYGSLDAGEQAGLKPVETNPARATLNLLVESAHYMKGQQILKTLADNGLTKEFDSPRFVPSDWTPLNEKVAGRGKYAPAEIARTFNNIFDPGFFSKHPGLETVRIYNNLMQTAAVSFSGFHVGLTAVESVATDLGLGLKEMSGGHPLDAARSFFRGPLAPIANIIKGRQFYFDEYLKNIDPGKQSPLLQQYLKGGARPDTSQAMTSLPSWREATKRLSDATGAWQKGNAALQTAGSFIRLLSSPIQDFWVRYGKLGATLRMHEMELERLGPGASDAELRAAAREVQDSADNRFGQMVRDNLFWNKSLSDAASVAFKFVDFNYGSLREMYGAGKDVPRAIVGAGMSQRLAHAMAFPAAVAMYGAVVNYMLTGEAPRDLEDAFFPRNGRTGPDGKPERVMIPSYLRSAYELGKPTADVLQGQPREGIQDAAQVAKSRLSPVVNMTSELVTNRDFLGNQVVNKDDPFIQQLGQIMGSVVRQAQPISKSAWERSEQLGGSTRDKVLSVAGIQPVPKSLGLDQSAAERELSLQLRENYGGGYAAPERIAHERAMNRLVATVRNGTGNFGQVYREEVKAGHIREGEDARGKTDLDKVVDRLQGNYIDRVKELPLGRQVDVLEKASTQAERSQIMTSLVDKLDALADLPPDQRTKLWNRIQAAQRRTLPQK